MQCEINFKARFITRLVQENSLSGGREDRKFYDFSPIVRNLFLWS